MSDIEPSLEERLTEKLSKENINRQIIATLLREDTPAQLAGALFIVSTLFNEAMDLLKKSMEKVSDESNSARMYEYLFEALEQHTQRGYKVLNSAKAGHEKVYGTLADKGAKKTKIIDECANVASQHPSWKLKAIRMQVAENLGDGYGIKTVQRATPNLRELLNK